MKVLFFGQCRDAAGGQGYIADLPKPVTQAELWARLIGEFPGLELFRKSARLARNETYLRGDEMLHPGDEIAVIPPVSGG